MLPGRVRRRRSWRGWSRGWGGRLRDVAGGVAGECEQIDSNGDGDSDYRVDTKD